MSDPSNRSGSADRDRLTACFRAVAEARARLRAARGLGVTALVERPLREDLLAALEAYEATITTLGAPVPPKLRAEITLFRRLQAPRSH